MVKRLFMDTYAIIEIYKGNAKYEVYKKDFAFLLNKLNLLEFAYFLIREGKEADISLLFEGLLKYNIDYDKQILIMSAEMKFKYLKQRLSFVDCIGYLLAKKHDAKFLTGDEHFRHMDNVEFVK